MRCTICLLLLALLLATGVSRPTIVFAELRPSEKAVVDGFDAETRLLYDEVEGVVASDKLGAQRKWIRLWKDVQSDADAKRSFIAYFKHTRDSRIAKLKPKLPIPTSLDQNEKAIAENLDSEMRGLYDAVSGINAAGKLKDQKKWIAFWEKTRSDSKASRAFISTRKYFKYLSDSRVTDEKAKLIPKDVDRKYAISDEEYLRLVGLYVRQRVCRMTNTCQNQ